MTGEGGKPRETATDLYLRGLAEVLDKINQDHPDPGTGFGAAMLRAAAFSSAMQELSQRPGIRATWWTRFRRFRRRVSWWLDQWREY